MKKLLLVFTLGTSLVGSVALAEKGTVLDRYTVPSETVVLPEVAYNLSGIAYNLDSNSYFVIQNNTGLIFEYDANLSRLLRTIRMVGLLDDDTEDIISLGNNEFAVSNEQNQIYFFKILPGQTVVDLNPKLQSVQFLQFPESEKDNAGLEGLCHAGGSTFYAVQEKRPKLVYRFERPANGVDATKPKRFRFVEPFNTEKIMKHRMSDLAGCVVDPETGHLIIVSHESSRLMELDSAGNILKMLDLPRHVDQYEGITFGPNKELILVSEPNSAIVFPRK